MERGSAGELLIPKQCLENALARHTAHRGAHAQKVVEIAVHGPGDPELPTEQVIHHGADGTTVVLRDERVRQPRRLEHHDEAAIVRQVTALLHPMLRSL
jgi:hypothetical protein